MADTTFTDYLTNVTASWLNDINDAVYQQTSGLTGATARTLASKLGEMVSVKDFGATGNGITDDTAAIQAAIDYVEQTRGTSGGIVFVPAGSYKCTAAIRVGGYVRLVGENSLISSLYWAASYTSGNCIELGPDQSGSFGFSGSYTFGSRLENLDLNALDIDRGSTKAVVYTVGAHQYSGLKNVTIRRFRNIGVFYDLGTGAPAYFTLDEVEMQGSATPPSSGSTIGLKSNAGGAIINCSGLIVQGDSGNLIAKGVQMVKDHLSLQSAHFEQCTIGISLEQNETNTRHNFIAGVSGHNSVATLVSIAATNNAVYNLINCNNETTSAVSTNVLLDNKTGVTVGGTNGRSITEYSNTENSIKKCVTVRVPTASVLTLNATPVTIIAAPDTGYAVVPTRIVVYKPSGTAYGGIAAGEDLVLKYTNASGAECSAQIETTGFLDQTTAETRYVGMPTTAVEPVAAAAVVLHLLSGEITTGDSDLYVRVWYDVVQTVFTV